MMRGNNWKLSLGLIDTIIQYNEFSTNGRVFAAYRPGTKKKRVMLYHTGESDTQEFITEFKQQVEGCKIPYKGVPKPSKKILQRKLKPMIECYTDVLQEYIVTEIEKHREGKE